MYILTPHSRERGEQGSLSLILFHMALLFGFLCLSELLDTLAALPFLLFGIRIFFMRPFILIFSVKTFAIADLVVVMGVQELHEVPKAEPSGGSHTQGDRSPSSSQRSHGLPATTPQQQGTHISGK